MNTTALALSFVLLSAISSRTQPISLVVRTSRDERSNLIHDLAFRGDGSLAVLGSAGTMVEQWTIGPTEEIVCLGNTFAAIDSAAWIGGSNYAVVAWPLQLTVWDLQNKRRVRDLETGTVYAWPLAAHPTGLCAWAATEGSETSIRIEDVLHDGATSANKTLTLGEETVVDLAISPDATSILAAVNRPFVHLWSLQGTNAIDLPLEAVPDGTPFGAPIGSLKNRAPKLFVPVPGMASAVGFSPDGKYVAAGNDRALHIWRLSNTNEVRRLRGFSGRIGAIEFSKDGNSVFAVAEDRVLRAWDRDGRMRILGDLRKLPRRLKCRGNGDVIAALYDDGTVEIFKSNEFSKLAEVTLYPRDAGWVVSTPQGLFDASEGAWTNITWSPDGSAKKFPAETFFSLYFEPGLLGVLLQDPKMLRPAPVIAAPNLELPSVKVALLSTKEGSMVLDTNGFRLVPERARFRVTATSNKKDGIFDLSVTHNGLLIQRWKGELNRQKDSVKFEIDVDLAPGDNVLSAFAFNKDGVRSPAAEWKRPMRGSGYMVPPVTLHALIVGVSKYQNTNLNLNFSSEDAEIAQKTLSLNEEYLRAISKKAFEDDGRGLDVVLPRKSPAVLASVKTTVLTNEHATRSNILKALSEIVGQAKRQDAVIFFFSGHGGTHSGHFYLFPHDTAIKESTKEIGASAEVSRSLISDADLEAIFFKLNTEHCALIIDACNSGALAEGAEWRGPIRSTSFSHLAYEKGFYLLVASGGSQRAFELGKFGHGLLTHALFDEGLLQSKADFFPADGRIELSEWLMYAAERTKQLSSEIWRQSPGAELQTARVIPKRLPELNTLIVGAK